MPGKLISSHPQDVNEEFKGPSGKAASASAGTCKAVNQAVLDFVQAISSDSLDECRLHKAAAFPEGVRPYPTQTPWGCWHGHAVRAGSWGWRGHRSGARRPQ